MSPSRTIEQPGLEAGLRRASPGPGSARGRGAASTPARAGATFSVLRSSSIVKPMLPREPLRAGADQQVVVGVLHHRLRDQRGRAHALERGHPAGPLLRAVHAARVELDDAVGIGQAAVADARVLGIELDDVDAGDERVEHVAAAGDQPEGAGDAGLLAVVRVLVAVGRRDDDRPGPGLQDGRRALDARRRDRDRRRPRRCGRSHVDSVGMACARVYDSWSTGRRLRARPSLRSSIVPQPSPSGPWRRSRRPMRVTYA